MSESIHEEFGRGQLDAQSFEAPYEEDPYAGMPHGEQQGQIDYLERSYGDENDPADYDPSDYDN